MNPENKIIFKKLGKSINIEILIDEETLWLSQKQMAVLFDKDSDTIGKHLASIYKSKELSKKATTANYSVVQNEGKRQVVRNILFYNLDAIISVGYRVNSKKGTQFRIWANKVLKEYLLKGYAINQKKLEFDAKRFKELQIQLNNLKKVYSEENLSLDDAKGLIKVIADYSTALEILEKFDKNDLEIKRSNSKNAVKINYEDIRNEIDELKNNLKAGDLFGVEKDEGFKSAIESIYQTFDNKDLYVSIFEKAANLLYLIIKNHSFIDGNKRIGAFTFIRFLDLNKLLYKKDNTKIIEESALVAIALLIAKSNPKDKEIMIKLVVNLLSL